MPRTTHVNISEPNAGCGVSSYGCGSSSSMRNVATPECEYSHLNLARSPNRKAVFIPVSFPNARLFRASRRPLEVGNMINVSPAGV